MRVSQTAIGLLFSTIAYQANASSYSRTKASKTSKTSKTSKSSKKSRSRQCPLKPIPILEDGFDDEPDWSAIIEIAFPPWDTPENGCPRLDALGGTLVSGFEDFPEAVANKFNSCYYTKAFAGLDPSKGGYPTPIDTHYPYEFAAPFLKQPGDGSVHHCNTDDNTVDIGSCPKLGNTCGKDCAKITDDYGIGHIPPFVPLAAVRNAYSSCGAKNICSDWFNFNTNGCNIKKSVLDDLVYDQFGNGDEIRFPGPVIIDGEPSSTYFRLEYGGESPACDGGNCRGPHYCTEDVADEGNIWGDFCPYVHTGPNSGKYRHPHIALAALELWIANQCMPENCPAQWLDSPNGQGYATNGETATSITWSKMDDEEDQMSQPAVPYMWPTDGSGIYPGFDDLYPSDQCTKLAPGQYVTEIAGLGPSCTA